MRSAWSPTRSMSLETLLVVWPKRLLALPMVFAVDLMSRSGDVSERGTLTPKTVFRRMRLRSTSPPATPAAAAPTATAGPLALLAAPLTVSTTPFELWLDPLRFAVLPAVRPELELFVVRLAVLPLERDEPLLDLAALLRLRVEAAVFDRDAPLPDFDLDPEPLAELRLRCPLLDAGLLLAISHTSFSEDIPFPSVGYPLSGRDNPKCGNLQPTRVCPRPRV
jgi:hypothetical protein